MDWSLFAYGDRGWGDELLRGLWVTMALAVTSYTVGLLVGLASGLIEMGRGFVIPRLFSAYAAILRSLPELLVIFAVYFGLALVLQAVASAAGWTWRPAIGPFAAGVIAIAAVTGSYVSEVTKGAIAAVPKGQREAAHALGLRPWQTLRLVILPLALRHAFPALANIWMAVIKKTPLVSAIQLEDFIRAAGTAGQNTRQYFVFYGAVIAVYLVLSGLSMLVQHRIETRLERHRGPAR
ncbi:MAG: ABC transporter permease subunit [Novosphingobium sp.]|jgi:His/Glu/Gln/Arg/opine family amino acid ABC transporter permease subunit|uniref:amino acid ABC transporter permease n=1 Tax=Novosphingobium sp. TaxID=1874826 RepID=UPI0022C59945|nr:ABC transporter permease subunit [Novosphingobium sp.]MCZ8036514.1 ABC transporter permease subunit [Novosphingobium sp.]